MMFTRLSYCRCARASSCAELRSVSSASVATPSNVPAASATKGDDPDRLNKSKEEMRLAYRTKKESPYKLGMHRSNALELVHKIPIVEVEGEMAICDGGGGALGHPLEYISLERPGAVEYCKYCSIRYTQKKKE